MSLAESIEATEMIYKYLTTAQAFYFGIKEPVMSAM
jgi:hypothetical protein